MSRQGARADNTNSSKQQFALGAPRLLARNVLRIDRLGAFRVGNVLRKRRNEQEGYKWFDKEDKTVGSGSVWFWRERTAALVALRVSAHLWIPKKAGALFAEVQIHLVCSRRRRASQSRAAYPGVPASASKSLSRSRKPRRLAGRPGGNASSVPGAGQPRCRRAGDRQDDARFSAG